MVAACGSEGDSGFGDLGGSDSPSSTSRDGGVGGGASKDGSVGGGASNGNACQKRLIQPEKTIPDMLVVLDRSGSMAPDGNDRGTDRWSGSVRAVTEVVQGYDDRVSFGLMTFPAVGSRSQSCGAGTVNVPVAIGRGDQIASTLARTRPEGFTPTAATLEAVKTVIDTSVIGDGVVPPKFVLLVTDGDPNCSRSWVAGGGGTGQPDLEARQQTIAAIQALTGLGVRTFVVGYQTADTGFAQQLDLMAAAGGTGEKSHRSVESGADLQSAIEEIAGRAISCSYKLDKPVADASYVLVTVQDKSRAFGKASDGWTLGPDNQTITLTGAACDAVQDGALISVEVVCSPVIVI